LAADNGRLKQQIELLHEEIRIKDARAGKTPAGSPNVAAAQGAVRVRW